MKGLTLRLRVSCVLKESEDFLGQQGRVVTPGFVSESLAELGMTQRLLSVGTMHEKAM